MTGLAQVLERIHAIQGKMKQFQPPRVKQLQNYYSSIQNKSFRSQLKNQMNKQEPIESPNQGRNINEAFISADKDNQIIESGSKGHEKKQSLLDIIKEASAKYKIPESLIKAVIKQESAFNPFAVSRAGAQGLMQLMPKTAKSLGVENSFDTKQNVFGGTKYLRDLLNQFGGNVSLSLAAYNAGPTRVMKSKGIPNIKETKNYVKNVIHHYQKIKNAK